jgi:hypothetical protein
MQEAFTRITIVVVLGLLSGAWGQGLPDLRLSRKDLTVLGLTVGDSTRAQVEAALGTARSTRSGEGADELVCYRAADRDDRTLLVFHFGALGGWTDVTEISISAGKPFSLNPEGCTPNKAISHNLEFLRGLRLGVSAAGVVKALGPSSHASKRKLSYYVSHPCSSKDLGTEETKPPSTSLCEVVDSVEARFSPEGELVFATFYHFVDQ